VSRIGTTEIESCSITFSNSENPEFSTRRPKISHTVCTVFLIRSIVRLIAAGPRQNSHSWLGISSISMTNIFVLLYKCLFYKWGRILDVERGSIFLFRHYVLCTAVAMTFHYCIAISAGARQHSDSCFRVPRDLGHLLLSDAYGSFRTPRLGDHIPYNIPLRFPSVSFETHITYSCCHLSIYAVIKASLNEDRTF
jgi:hypothetical protein